MDGLWFDQQAFILCAKEKGDIIKICKRSIQKQINSEIGLAAISSWDCKELNGIQLLEKLSSVSTNGQLTKDESSVVYILEKDFDPKTIDKDTFFHVNGKAYQVELIDFLLQRQGVPIYHKYKLQETQQTIVI